MIINNCQNIGGEISMKNKKVILILTALITFIVLGSMSFAQSLPCSPACDDKPDCDIDGHDALECGGDDCDDDNPEVYDGAPELCDGLDNNCNGDIPDDEKDLDEDGFAACAYDGHIPGYDCDDFNNETNIDATEVCDGLDNNCNGDIPDIEKDIDGDGFAPCVYDGHIPGDDCDDINPQINPNATESCDNEIDDDCDGNIDCNDDDCIDYPGCSNEIPEYPSAAIAPMILIFSMMLLKSKHIPQ